MQQNLRLPSKLHIHFLTYFKIQHNSRSQQQQNIKFHKKIYSPFSNKKKFFSFLIL